MGGAGWTAGQDPAPKTKGLKRALVSGAPENRATPLESPLPVNSFHVGDSQFVSVFVSLHSS